MRWTTVTTHEVAVALDRAHRRIEAAARGAGRQSSDVTLVAVTKTVPLSLIREALLAGHRVFGENRVQEALPKIEELTAEFQDARWHLIGHLQSNKAKLAVGAFSLIESVDSARLAHRLDRLAADRGTTLPILLEVNISGEPSKSGFSAVGVESILAEVRSFGHLAVHGLMTIAPITDDPESVRWVFTRLRELRDELASRYRLDRFTTLSMGMSGDFEVAIEEGATMVRLGRALFGERPLPAGKA